MNEDLYAQPQPLARPRTPSPIAHEGQRLAEQWKAPVGYWLRRGANASLIRVGMGLPLDKGVDDPVLAECDHEGHTVWHYWAHCAHHCAPETNNFKCLAQSKAIVSLCNKLSNKGEHPWHRLAFMGHHQALTQWRQKLPSWTETALPETSCGDGLWHCAAWSGETAFIQAMNQTPTSTINQPNHEGLTPLIIGVHRLDTAGVLLLLEQGADPNVADRQGRNALHHAALEANHDLVARLDQAGGNGDLPDKSKTTPEQILEQRRHYNDRERMLIRGHWLRRYENRNRF